MATAREAHPIQRKLWPVAYDVALTVARRLVGARLTIVDEGGQDAIAGTAPVVIAANHQGHLDYDTVLLAAPRSRRRRLRYVASAALLGRLGEGGGAAGEVQRWVLRGIYEYVHRVIPVGESLTGSAAINAMTAAIDAGDTVVIFPEGERNTDPELSPLRPGVGVLAARTKVPVLPIRIDGTKFMTSAHGRPTRSKPRITARLREPLVAHADESPEAFLARLAEALEPPPQTGRPQALLLGAPASDAWYLPRLLHRCGFDVDVITTPTRHFATRRHVRALTVVATLDGVLRAGAERARVQDYDWVIPVNDDFLGALRARADIPLEDRLRLAPVTGAAGLSILASKAATARALERAGLAVPAYAVVADLAQAIEAGERFGYPLMAKADLGHSGTGVRRVEAASTLAEVLRDLGPGEVLLQERFPGPVVDVSGLFRDGALVHFTYSTELERLGEFGPSSMRSYEPTASLPEQVRIDLGRIGEALGLDGFATISAFATGEGGLSFFELDLRPNIWVGHGADVGDDPIPRIRAAFGLGPPVARGESGPSPAAAVHGHYLRRPLKDLALGRANAWRGFPLDSPDAWLLTARRLRRADG